ncbi:MFS general substrate transporter [Melanomma pulvis-pyrius CBS 109.77]|uniref:MFS general substrate transporter n=1 Tax=Melanomma pulvis-pyrius CBS 109.77 TaxID=1314802 RepID=A0A6A6X769_9PLEO|nr:MFS general substrate transporter [Melanomma pulvis-pyrius CBS 109.77]
MEKADGLLVSDHIHIEDGHEKKLGADDTSVMNTSVASKIQQDSEPERSTESVNEVAEPERTIRGFQWFLAYTSLISTVLLYALDGTIVADIQPAIVATLGEIEKLPWIGIALAVGTISILPLGKAYGVFNVKWLFMSMVVLFEIGSVVCGAAPNMNAFIIGRVIQGIGGCGCYTGSLSFISMTTTKAERPLYLSGVIAIWGIGSVIGPIVGGAFAESSVTWRMAFYINLAIAALTAPGLIFYLPSVNPVDLPFTRKLWTQDWVGLFIFSAGSVCFTFALAFGGAVYAFDSPPLIAFWVVTGVLLIAFIVVTLRPIGVPKEHRLYPLHLNKSLQMNLLMLAVFVSMGAMMVTLYYTPLFFQFSRGDSPIRAGVRILPFMCCIIAAEVINGGLMPKFGYHMPWYVVGSTLLLIGSALMMTLDNSTTANQIYGYTSLIGLGCGTYLTAGFAVAQVLVPASELSNSVGFMAIGQMMGQIVLLCLAGTLYQNLAYTRIIDVVPGISRPGAFQLTTGRHSPAFENLSEELQNEVVEIVTRGIRNAFAPIVPAAALSLIGSLFMTRKKVY